MHPCLLVLSLRVLSCWTWSHATNVLRYRTSARTRRMSFRGYILIYYSPLALFCDECEFAQPWLCYSIRIALWIWLICEGYMHPCLLVRSLRLLSCWTSTHDNNIWRNRTSARTHIFRLSGSTYWFLLYSPLTLFRWKCDFAQPWLCYSIRIALWIWLICEGCMHPCLLVLSLRVLSCWTSSHDNNIWRNRTSARTHIFRLSGSTYWFLLYSPLTLFRWECDFAQPWLYYSIRIALWIWLICEGCMHPCLLVLSLRVLSCWTSSHDNNIWRNRTSARTPIFRLSVRTYWFLLCSPLTLFRWECEFAQPWLYYSIRMALWIWLICEGCIHSYLRDRFACCLAEPHHMITIFGGIGRLRVRTSFVSQCVRIESLYSPLTPFRCECEFVQPWLYYSIRNCTWNMIDLWRLYPCLIVLSLRVLSCWTWSHATNIWRCRTAARTHLMCFRWYVLIDFAARSHRSVVNASLSSPCRITAFEITPEKGLICEACIHAYLCYRFACCLAEPDHMRRKFGGIGRLRVRTSFVSQIVRIDLLYSPLTLFRCECDFGQPWLYYSIRDRTWNIIDLWRLYRCVLNCAIASCAVLLNLTDHMRRKFGGIGRPLVRPSFVSQLVRIHLLYSPLTLFSIRIALWIWLICEGCIHAYLCDRFACGSACWIDCTSRIIGGIGHLVVRASDVFQSVRVDLPY